MADIAPTAPPGVQAPLDAPAVLSEPSGIVDRMTRDTPTRLRLLSIITALAIVAAGVLSFIAASAVVSATSRIDESSGPVLIATQEVLASLAEADAAATGVHLSGVVEDREQRGLYEQALNRTAAGVERIARLIGDDDASHDALVSINGSLAEYSGTVEASRLANQAGLAGADQRLVDSINLIRADISPEVASITERAQATLGDDIDAGEVEVVLAYLALGLALVMLLLGQFYLAGRTRRLLSPLLVLATVAVVALIVGLYSLYTNQQRHLEQARSGGYESIALTAEIQSNAFRYKSNEGLALIQGPKAFPPSERQRLATLLSAIPIDTAQVAQVHGGGVPVTNSGLLIAAAAKADDQRKHAAAAEMLARWSRYITTSDAIDNLLRADDLAAASRLAGGQSNADFNGFNTAVESVLSDNRTQFQDGVSEALTTLDWLRPLVVVLAGLAVLLSWSGFDRRVRDYR